MLLKSQTSLGTASQSSEVVISQVVFFILLIFVEMQLLSCKHLFKLTLQINTLSCTYVYVGIKCRGREVLVHCLNKI